MRAAPPVFRAAAPDAADRARTNARPAAIAVIAAVADRQMFSRVRRPARLSLAGTLPVIAASIPLHSPAGGATVFVSSCNGARRPRQRATSAANCGSDASRASAARRSSALSSPSACSAAIAEASSGWRSSVIAQGTRAGATVRAGSSSSSSAEARLRAPPDRDSSCRRKMPTGSSFARDRRARRGSGAVVMHPPLARATSSDEGRSSEISPASSIGALTAPRLRNRSIALLRAMVAAQVIALALAGSNSAAFRQMVTNTSWSTSCASASSRTRRRQMPYNFADVRS